MVTDISSVNGSIWSFTPTGQKSIRYNKSDVVKYFFQGTSPSSLVINFSISVNEGSKVILLTDLRVGGSPTAPATEAAALTAIDAVFLKAAPPATTTVASVAFASNKSSADSLTRISGTFVRVASDESQSDSPKAMYLDNGTSLEFQYNIQ